MTYREQVKAAKRKIVSDALDAAGGNVHKAARTLRVHRSVIYKIVGKPCRETRYANEGNEQWRALQ